METGATGSRAGRVEAVVVAGAATALAVWWLWPLPASPATRAGYEIGANGLGAADFHLIVWALAWDTHALVHDPLHLFHANIFHPSTLSLAYSEHFLGYVPIFAPVWWATRNPILAVNAVVLSSYPLAAVGAYLLARRFTSGPGAAAAGFFYAFCPWRYLSLTHLHMLGVAWLPLALLFTDRWLESGRARDAVLLAVALLLQALSSLYLAYALLLAYGTALPLALVRWRARCDRRRLAGLGLALAAVAAVVVLTSVPYLTLRCLGLVPSYGVGEGLVPLGFLYSRDAPWRYVRAEGVGPVGYALALVALLPPWRTGGAARVLGVALVVVGLASAFGPGGVPIAGHTLWTPYELLLAWVPGFASVRLPARFVVVAQLGFALLAGIGLGRCAARRSAVTGWALAGIAAAAALATYLPLPPIAIHDEPTGAAVPPAYRWLGEHGEGRALLELPEAPPSEVGLRMYLSTFHWLPLVEGYSAYPPPTAAYVHRLAGGLPSEDALQALVDTVDVGWLLVHGDARSWNGPLPAGLERSGQWGTDALFRVTRPVRDDRRGRLLSTTETLDGVPLAPLGDRCPGELRVIEPPPDPWPPRSTAAITVEVRNLGDRPWPAHGFVPRHLVRLRACIAPPAAPACTAPPVALPTDLPPGGRVSVPVTLTAPFWPGRYVLHVGLVQVGDPPPDSCGVAPLRIPIHAATTPRRPG